jgi:hypothetical protein
MKLSRATLLGMTILILIHLWRRYVGIRRVRRNIARLERLLAPRPDIYGIEKMRLYPGAVWEVDDIATVHVLPTNYTQIHGDAFLAAFEEAGSM